MGLGSWLRPARARDDSTPARVRHLRSCAGPGRGIPSTAPGWLADALGRALTVPRGVTDDRGQPAHPGSRRRRRRRDAALRSGRPERPPRLRRLRHRRARAAGHLRGGRLPAVARRAAHAGPARQVPGRAGGGAARSRTTWSAPSPSCPRDTDPMRVLQAAVAMLGMHDPDATDNSRAANLRKAVRLTSQFATAICAHHRVRSGQAPVPPRRSSRTRPTSSTCSPGSGRAAVDHQGLRREPRRSTPSTS